MTVIFDAPHEFIHKYLDETGQTEEEARKALSDLEKEVEAAP